MGKKLVITLICALFLYVGISVFLTNKEEGNQPITVENVFKLVRSLWGDTQENSVVIPKLSKDIQLDAFYKSHWEGDQGHFILVANQISSKLGPDIKSEDFMKLYKTQRVRILFEKKQFDTVDSEPRKWVFLADEKGQKYLGWVFLDQLVFPKQFSVFNGSNLTNFAYEKGEYHGEFKFKNKGKFKINWKSQGGGLYLKGSDTGQLYIFDNIIWAKKKNQDFLYEFFLIDETNHIHQEFRFKSDSISLNIYSLPKAN